MHIGGEHLGNADRRRGQQLWTGLRSFHVFDLLRGLSGCCRPAGRSAHETAEVLHVDPVRQQVGCQCRAWRAWRDLQVAAQVAAAKPPRHAGEFNSSVLKRKLAADAVGRRLRRRDAGERQKQRHVGTGESEFQIRSLQCERIADVALERDACRAVFQLEVDRIGRAGITQCQDRATLRADGDGLVGIGAFAIDDQRLPFGGNVQRRVGSLLGDLHVCDAIVDFEVADFRVRG
jgi:hypothetical protein